MRMCSPLPSWRLHDPPAGMMVYPTTAPVIDSYSFIGTSNEAVVGQRSRVRDRATNDHSVHFPIVTRPPAAATASSASLTFDTCSTVGFLPASISPFATLLSIDHCVRSGLKPVLTDQMQLSVSTFQANSTASFGFFVASTMIGITLSFSL